MGALAILGCGQPLISSDPARVPACGAGAVITEMPLPGGWTIDNGVPPFQPDAIVTGADGNLWMTEVGVNAIGRLTPDGRHDSFPVPDLPLGAKGLLGMTAGPDGNVWFAECGNQEPSIGGVGMITPDGVITQFSLPSTTPTNRCPSYLAVGPDGNIWFSEWGANGLGRVTPDGVFTEFFLPGTSDWRDMPSQFTVGPDGNFWFDEVDRIGKVTLSGEVTFYPLQIPPNGGPGSMIAGPDGNIWWTAPSENTLRRLTVPAVDGEQLRFKDFAPGWDTSQDRTDDLTLGPDGNIWYAGWTNVGCFTMDGRFHDVPVPSGLLVGHMTLGPDGALWFTEPGEDRIGRVSLN